METAYPDLTAAAQAASSDRQKTAGPYITLEEDAVLFKKTKKTLNVVETAYMPTEKGGLPEAIRLVVELTGDERSVRRFKQLRDICEANRCTDVWAEAQRSTHRRLLRQGDEPLDRPGAYFCTALTMLLGERGITVPTGTLQERRSVRGQIAASLNFGDPGPEDS